MEGKATFSRRLREARKAKRISQCELGIRAGFDPSVASARVNQYERGKHVPDLLTAQRLAAALGMPVSYLFEPDDELAGLIALTAQLSPDALRTLVEHARGLTGCRPDAADSALDVSATP